MNNMHKLHPCRLCDKRMAVPGSIACTMCDVEIFPTIENVEAFRVG